MWLIMRGALTAKVNKLHQSYYLPSMTAIATAIYEPVGETRSLARPTPNTSTISSRVSKSWTAPIPTRWTAA